MIVIPSIAVVASDLAEQRERLRDLEWAGFSRVEFQRPRTADAAADLRPLEDLIRDARVPVQVAGGFETGEMVERVLDLGVERVVLGGRALDDPEWLSSTAAAFPRQLMVETPARERRIRTRGLLRSVSVDLADVGDALDGMPLAGLVVEFPGDDELPFAELAALEDLADDADWPVYLRGVEPTTAHLRDLEFRGVAGVLVDLRRIVDPADLAALARL